MKPKEIEILIKHRLEQAHEALDSVDYKIIKPISADKANEIWQKAVKFVHAVEHYLIGD